METEKNKAIALRFIQVWGKGELEIIDELASPAISVHYPTFPQAIKGGEAFKQKLTEFRSVFPDGDLRVEEQIAEGDKVVLRWSYSGTHKGLIMDIPATGKKVNWTGITIYRITDGKVSEERGQEDVFGVLRQIGAIPQRKTQ
jgi:steroid delta-isomerase-like uncharacterized protein